MYKVFIVDDEVIIRERIRSHIDWESTHFVLAGEASDGEMALSMIKDIKPDILVTDIYMPFLGGIQLARIVKQSMPWVRIIILSGYDEFDYAQKAISIGVQEYILKPIRASELLSALEKAAQSIEDEKKQRADAEALKASIVNLSSMNEEQLFLDLLTGAIASGDAIERAMELGIDIVAPNYSVMITVLSRMPGEESMQNELLIARADMKALAKANAHVWQSFGAVDKMAAIVMGDGEESSEERAFAFAQAIMHEIPSNTGYAVSICIGGSVSHLGDIPRSYLDADLVYKRLGTIGKVFCTKDLEAAEPGSIAFDGIPTGDQLKYASASDIPEIIRKYMEPLNGSSIKSTLLSNYIVMDVLVSCSRLVHECGGDPSKILPQSSDLAKLALRISSPGGLRSSIEEILSRAFEFRDSSVGTKYTATIKKAQEYIQENFASQDISLQTVSKHVALSSNHFCTIFAQETGQTFIEFLTSIRIKRAKSLLLETSMRTGEVAYAVGYNDPHYFSYIFKKQTGLTPRDFRSAE